jgi:exodeoxyribonuclease VII small subunit
VLVYKAGRREVNDANAALDARGSASRYRLTAGPIQGSRRMPQSSPATFEAALAELEQIVATMEGGQLPLKESLAAYERGAQLLQYCQNALKEAQQQVQVLEKGVLKCFEPEGGESEP